MGTLPVSHPYFALSPLTARDPWINSAYRPMSAAACNRWHRIAGKLPRFQSAHEVTVTSCARLKAQYGETMELGREAMAKRDVQGYTCCRSHRIGVQARFLKRRAAQKNANRTNGKEGCTYKACNRKGHGADRQSTVPQKMQ